MTNFEKIKKWDSYKFSTYTNLLVVRTLNLVGIDTNDIKIDEMIEEYNNWLNSDDANDI